MSRKQRGRHDWARVLFFVFCSLKYNNVIMTIINLPLTITGLLMNNQLKLSWTPKIETYTKLSGH